MRLCVEARVYNRNNKREHWSKKYRADKAAKDAVFAAWMEAGKPVAVFQPGDRPQVKVKLVRRAPRKMDSDNSISALKAVRDALAEHVLELDDGDPRVLWEYDQGGPYAPKRHHVDVEIIYL